MEKTFKKYKKTAAAILLAFFIGTSLFWPFYEARALVPVTDIPALAVLNAIAVATGGTAVSTGSLWTKEYILDAIAWGIGRILIHALGQSVVNWIRTGGTKGGPLFVEDFGEHFRRELDNAAGVFLEEFFRQLKVNPGFLCSPFHIQLGNLLNTSLLRNRQTFFRRASCTLTDIVQNVQNFEVNFNAGGWNAFNALLEPNNSIMGMYLASLDEADRRQMDAFLKASYEITTSRGLLAWKFCDKTPEGREINCKIKTPGTVVADQLKDVISDQQTRLVIADEINEIVVAAIEQLIGWAITGGGGERGLRDYQTIDIDAPFPKVAIIFPAEGATVSGTTTVAAVASDDKAVTGVTFYLDGRALGLEDTLEPYAVLWDTRLLNDGPHFLSAIAQDPTHNSQVSELIKVEVLNATSTATSTGAR